MPISELHSAISCNDVWEKMATDWAGSYTCGARIEWLISQGVSSDKARLQVADEFPDVCGPCTPLSCNDVWEEVATDWAGSYTCGARIEWLISQGNPSDKARLQVADEFPNICGPCHYPPE